MESEARQRTQRNRRRERAQRMQAQKEKGGAGDASGIGGGDTGEDESPVRQKPSRPPIRRKKSKDQALLEEDIIDGFAILAFKTYEDLENAVRRSKEKSKEVLSSHVDPDTGQPLLPPSLPNTLIKNKKITTPNKVIYNPNGNKCTVVKTLNSFNNDPSTSDDSGRASERVSGPNECDDAQDRLSDGSSHSGSGRGYICDSEDEDDKVSDAGSDLFSTSRIFESPDHSQVRSTDNVANNNLTEICRSSAPTCPSLVTNFTAAVVVPLPTPLNSSVLLTGTVPDVSDRLSTKTPSTCLSRSCEPVAPSPPILSPIVTPPIVKQSPPILQNGPLNYYPPPVRPTHPHPPLFTPYSHSLKPPLHSSTPNSVHPVNSIHTGLAYPPVNSRHHHLSTGVKPEPGLCEKPHPPYSSSPHRSRSPCRNQHEKVLKSPLLVKSGVSSVTTIAPTIPPSHSHHHGTSTTVHSSVNLPHHHREPQHAYTNHQREALSNYQRDHHTDIVPHRDSVVINSSHNRESVRRSGHHSVPVSSHSGGVGVGVVVPPVRVHSPRGHSPGRERDSYSSNVSSLSRGSVTPLGSTIPPITLSPLSSTTPVPSLAFSKAASWVSSSGLVGSSAPRLSPRPTPSFPSSSLPPPPSVSHTGMFAPPPLTTTTTTSLGHTGPFSAEALFQTNQADLLRRELDSRFLASQEQQRSLVGISPSPFALRTEMHHHQHQHTHVHQHTPILPPPLGTPPTALFPPPLVNTLKSKFKEVPKLGGVDSSFYRQNLGLPGYPGFSPLLPPAGLPGSTPFVPPSQLAAFTPKKAGRWNAMHVRIAWEIYHHQQKQQSESKLASGSGSNPSSSSAGPTKLTPPSMGSSDLLRPPNHLFPTLGPSPEFGAPFSLLAGPPSHRSPFDTLPHHMGLFNPGHHLGPGMSPFPRYPSFPAPPNAFGPLGPLGGGIYAHRELPGLPHLPQHEPWRSLHRTPPGFPTTVSSTWPLKPESSLLERDRREHEERERREREERRQKEELKRKESLERRNKEEERQKERDRELHREARNNGCPPHRTPHNFTHHNKPEKLVNRDRSPLRTDNGAMLPPHHTVYQENGEVKEKDIKPQTNESKVKVKEEPRKEEEKEMERLEKQVTRTDVPIVNDYLTRSPFPPHGLPMSLLDRSRMMGPFGLGHTPTLDPRGPPPHPSMAIPWGAPDPFRDPYLTSRDPLGLEREREHLMRMNFLFPREREVMELSRHPLDPVRELDRQMMERSKMVGAGLYPPPHSMFPPTNPMLSSLRPGSKGSPPLVSPLHPPTGIPPLISSANQNHMGNRSSPAVHKLTPNACPTPPRPLENSHELHKKEESQSR